MLKLFNNNKTKRQHYTLWLLPQSIQNKVLLVGCEHVHFFDYFKTT